MNIIYIYDLGIIYDHIISPKSPLIFMGMISWGFMVILVMKDRIFWGIQR